MHKPSLPSALFVCLLIGTTTITSAVADGLTRGTGPHQARTVRELALAAARSIAIDRHVWAAVEDGSDSDQHT